MGAAFVTGGSSGIGLELAKGLAAQGHSIALFARDANKLDEAVKVLSASFPGQIFTAHSVDVGDADAVNGAVSDAVSRHGAPDWAIANAGIAQPGLFREQTLSSFDDQMRSNYMGALYFAKSVTPHMTTGNLVFVSSGAAFFGIYGYSAYAPTKFAMRGLAEVLRVELAPDITVSLAYPPDTDTPQFETENLTKPAVTKKITEGAGLWQPKDVADMILKRASAGKFTIAPGFQMKALLALHSLLGPALRAWQISIARKHR